MCLYINYMCLYINFTLNKGYQYNLYLNLKLLLY